MRAILHPGFHKTGTTTLQKALERNARMLAPHLRLIPRATLRPAGRAARAFSARRDPLELALLRYELAEALAGVDPADPRPLILSCEDLAGHMPGRDGVESYAAAPELMRALIDTLRALWPGVDPELFFSTRAPDSWLASLHVQALRASRMTLDAASFAARYRGAADLDVVVAEIAATLAPLPVHSARLEDSARRPLGPLASLLDLLPLPEEVRAALVPVPAANRAPDCAARLLEINRGDLDDAAAHAAKQALLAGCA